MHLPRGATCPMSASVTARRCSSSRDERARGSMIGAVLRQFLGKKPDGDALEWLRSGTALHAAGKHAEAAQVFEARLCSDPRDVSALQGLAAALLAQGRAREGLT